MLVAIALGSNLGDRAATLRAAKRRLRAEPGVLLVVDSELYETAPVGGPAGQGAYLNAVALLETLLSADDLLALLHRIEHQFGRVRSAQDGPRTLDLDLLLYGDAVIQTPTLTVPHPRLHERAFVLVPLAEMGDAKELRHPTLNKTMQELHDALPIEERREVRKVFPKIEAPPTLAGLTAFVTGSTAGIGADIAKTFEDHGATVIRHGRFPRDQQRYLYGNLADAGVAERLATEAWDAAGGSLDILVCNAGADTLTGDAAKWSFERKLQELLAVDLVGTMLLSRSIGSTMKARGRGCILTIGWDQAETGMDGDSGQLFAAVKGAVMCFTRSLALSLAPEVRVNCIAPGWIRTAWGETASPLWQERVRRETPLGVWGLPEDIAAAALMLASPAASFLTGQTLRVNGGAVRG